MEVPSTFGITVGSPPSIIKSTLLVPSTAARPIAAHVPVKANETPVPGQVSSLVAGLTLPR